MSDTRKILIIGASRGIGLGLYLSRELCELNQAQLRYLEQPRGTRFRIRFASAPT